MGDAATTLPGWLRRWGVGAWLVVGIVLVVVGGVWLLALTKSIVGPLIFGMVVGAVGGALVDRMENGGLPRAAAAGVVMLALVLVGVLVIGLVLGGITSQASNIDAATAHAVDRIQGWAKDLGITSAKDAAADIKKIVPQLGHTMLVGVAHGIAGLASVAVFLGFSAFTSFFLLKDGPAMGRWIERHMGMQPAEARIVTGDIVRALRKYFLGLTIVGAFNAVVVGLGALILGAPLPGTIAVVTFFGSFVPIIGAWTAGIFAFALVLSEQGSGDAVIMALIVFLANGPLQQIVQPIAYGATLQLNPLVVFSVTIGAGALFGMVGLVLGAPLVSAAVNINRDLGELRATSPGRAPPASASVEAVGG